ncbi:MAG TPA: thioredoxin family protein [Clostridia bacterium]|nr:thioredoxin family protein [Clostridia bacterium]
MILKLFTQPDCGKCPSAKQVVVKLKTQNSKLKIEEFDVTTVDGMAEASFYTVMATPTILLCDNTGKILKDWRGQIPALTELKRATA